LKLSRFSQLNKWLCHYFDVDSITFYPLTGDAGFRKYYRFELQNTAYIAVDAIPEMSNNLAFVEIQKTFQKSDINVPDIIVSDLAQGFLCLSDFGDELFSDNLTLNNMEQAYKKAIKLLPTIANVSLPENYTLPLYSADFIRVELNIFTQWLLGEHLSLSLSEQEQCSLDNCFNILIQSAIEQPQVVVHRDYHSRNLMLLPDEENSIGVIDFQDAVIGPITYDIVSLLRDCYVKWPTENVEALFQYYCQLVDLENKCSEVKPEQYVRWFDLMGLQRHIKASGIFARLFHRDNKEGYLKDIPLTLSYIVDISAKYPELKALHDLVLNKVVPALQNKEKSKEESKAESKVNLNGAGS